MYPNPLPPEADRELAKILVAAEKEKIKILITVDTRHPYKETLSYHIKGEAMQNNRLSLIVDRSENGPFMKETAYDLALARKTMELVRKHGIHFDRSMIVPTDDDMADRLYQAGLELFLEMGVYNQSTERCIHFSREEVETAVAEAPRAIHPGHRKGCP